MLQSSAEDQELLLGRRRSAQWPVAPGPDRRPGGRCSPGTVRLRMRGRGRRCDADARSAGIEQAVPGRPRIGSRHGRQLPDRSRRRGVPLEGVYSVPAGPRRPAGSARAVKRLPPVCGVGPGRRDHARSSSTVAQRIRRELDVWFARMAAQLRTRKIRVCLSGGLDSGIIAALARKYFTDVTGYTYSYGTGPAPRQRRREQCGAAGRSATHPAPHRPGIGRRRHGRVDDALCYGQDWRDFNVHCAIVNEILARGHPARRGRRTWCARRSC